MSIVECQLYDHLFNDLINFLEYSLFQLLDVSLFHKCKVRRVAQIRNRYDQAPHLTQDITWKSDKTYLNITNWSQEVCPFVRQVSMASILMLYCPEQSHPELPILSYKLLSQTGYSICNDVVHLSVCLSFSPPRTISQYLYIRFDAFFV